MFKNLQKNNKGFTIIEVLIVLAIAGLIMLIVFLAVPALQRNQRNSGRRNDVGRLGGAVSEYYANNNGAVPTAAGPITDSAGTLSQYNAGNVSVQSGAAAVAAQTNIANVRIVTGATCGTAGATVPGTARQVAIQFMVEGGGGNTAVCQEV